MPDIKRLSAGVVNKIAAGEVIERPASVVKELIENAVDAGSTRIDVSIQQGGTQLIRVSDNGCGIAADQLPLALASHATSKIQDAEDLFRVRSMGFRGEALASIAAVSQLVIRSRSADSDAGAELEIQGGHARDQQPCGCAQGTTLEVRNLFYNTPVRRKFLRTTQTEMGHVTEAFTRVALANPAIQMTLRHNDRVVHDLPYVERWLDRIRAFFGSELGDSLIWIESQEGGVRIAGYVADPRFSRGNNRMQYVLLNGRHIRDRSLQHALGEAYRGLLLTGRFPIAFLRFEMPPEMVDVNVHPAKLEVRFADGGRLYSQLLGTLRSKFLATDLTARAQLSEPVEAAASTGHDPHHAQQHRQKLVQWARGEPLSDSTGGPAGLSAAPSGAAPWDAGPPAFRPFGQSMMEGVNGPADEGAGSTNQISAPPDVPEPRGVGMQVHNRYLVAEDAQGLVVIDQHALHERILYEQLRRRVMAGTLESQRLLVPDPVSLMPPEVAAVLEARELLRELGIEVEPFGGDTILVSSYPAMLANFSPEDVLRQVVQQLTGDGQSLNRRNLLDELLHMIACKAAIKAGDRLSTEEVTELLRQRHLYQDTHHCPHGRPTSLVFTNEELDKRFKRI